MNSSRAAALPRAKRLLRREQFTGALAARPAAVRRYFSVFVQGNALFRSRIGVIVSRKTAARAVDRNRIKRLVREAFRQKPGGFGGNDLVVLARRCPTREGWGAARVELAGLFAQLAEQFHKRGA